MMSILVWLERWLDQHIDRALLATRIPEPPITTSFAPVSVTPDVVATHRPCICPDLRHSEPS